MISPSSLTYFMERQLPTLKQSRLMWMRNPKKELDNQDLSAFQTTVGVVSEMEKETVHIYFFLSLYLHFSDESSQFADEFS